MDRIKKRFLFRAYFRALAAFLIILTGYIGLSLYFINTQSDHLAQIRRDEIKRVVNSGYNLIVPYLEEYRNNLVSRDGALEKITAIISRMTFEDSLGKNYLFMSSFEGVMLVQPFEPWKIGTSQWDLRDHNGIYIIRELVKTATSPQGEGYVTYHYFNPDLDREMEKLSYVIGLKELGCYLGYGLYMDDIKAQWVSYIGSSAVLMMLLFAAIFLLVGGIILPVLKTSDILMTYFNSMAESPDVLYPVTPDQMGKNLYTGFMIGSFNKMIERISDYSRRLSGSEEKFRSFFANSAEAIIFVSYDGLIIDANSSAMKVFRYSGTEIARMEFSILFEERERAGFFLSSLKGTGYLKNMEVKMKNRDSHIIDAVITAMLSGDKPENEKIYYFIIRDMTEQKKLEKQLVQSQKMETIGSLTGGIAHDFNNYLGAITGTVSLLKYEFEEKNSLSPELFRKYTGILEESCENAARMITQLQSVSGRYTEESSVRELGQLCSHVADICRNTIDKSVTIDYRKPEAPVFVSADSRIEQVILNICINASHAMTIMRKNGAPWGGTLSLTVSRENIGWRGGYAVIAVRDTGVGIEADRLEKIFDPFYTTKERGQGSGLGLAIAYRTAVQHKGFITADSVSGEGSIFRLFLPLADSAESGRELDRTVFIPLSGRALVVDDEKVFRETLSGMVRKTGLRCDAVTSAEEALEILGKESGSYSLVILDVAMPGLSGTEAYPMIKRINPGIRILLTSGYGSDPRIESIVREGVDGFIQKPYNYETLYRKIVSVLQS